MAYVLHSPNAAPTNISIDWLVGCNALCINSAKVYIIAHFLIALVSQSIAMDVLEEATTSASNEYWYSFIAVTLTLASLLSFGGLTDRRPWCISVEAIRLLVVGSVLLGAMYHHSSPGIYAVCGAIRAVSCIAS
jgi:uncharacterized membrane protein